MKLSELDNWQGLQLDYRKEKSQKIRCCGKSKRKGDDEYDKS